MAAPAKRYSLAFPITFACLFAGLALISAIFLIVNTQASNDYSNQSSPNYDQSGLGQTVTGFMGILSGLALTLFAFLTLVCLLFIYLRVRHNKKIQSYPWNNKTPTKPIK
ncbi:MAG TPA: hypothetical protein VLG47_06440 [Candidatus Saccharimonadales bacterium]|nr:hypothetical protein [Candidatus Saccharimonadales bacterium]